MEISEIFYSIQGEGPQVGLPAWFIRTAGCNLNCSWCDSKYALKKGKEMDIEDIKKEITNDCSYVVITGGEPLLQKGLLKLMKLLRGRKIYVETNGTIYKPTIVGFATFIVSPKPEFMNKKYLESLKKWVGHATFKFVIGAEYDFLQAKALCEKLDIRKEDIYLMPKGIDNDILKSNMIQIIKFMNRYKWYVHLTPRLHIYLYGNKRGV